MRIPQEIMKCAVFLRYQSKDGLVWAGTGFFVGAALPNQAEGRFVSYLVTARHVIESIRSKSTDHNVRVRVNLKSGKADEFIIPLDKWRHHPEEHIDLSAICFTHLWREDMDHFFFVQRSFLDTDNKVEGYDVGPGDDVFLTGLFSRHTGTTKNLPVIRVGNIASMPIESMKLVFKDGRQGHVPVYLIESRSIGGLSGSPVFWNNVPRLEEHLGTQPVTLFLGVILGHWDEDTTAKTVVDATKSEDRINMGMAFVLPAKHLSELLNIPQFEGERQELASSVGSASCGP